MAQTRKGKREKRRISADAHDALTGGPLNRARYVLHLPSDTDERPVPLRLHVGQSETVNHESIRDAPGGLAFSPQMSRYLKGVQPARFDAARLLWGQWWRIPYVRERLIMHLGVDRAQLVIRYETTGADLATLASEYGKGPAWGGRAVSRARHLVRRKYLPHYELAHLRILADILLPERSSSGGTR
jgi:hypothetical protein